MHTLYTINSDVLKIAQQLGVDLDDVRDEIQNVIYTLRDKTRYLSTLSSR